MKDEAMHLGRLQRGEKAAIEEFLDRFGPQVGRLAARYAPTPGDAEDLTQEILLDLVRSIPKFRGEASLSTWIYRIALHHGVRHQQKSARQIAGTDVSEDENLACARPQPAQTFARQELSQQVHCALKNLSDLQREIVVLHELHGLTYSQCAEILQIPVGTVKSRLSNAFRALRVLLGPYVLEEQS